MKGSFAALLAVISVVVVGCGYDEKSYRYGYNEISQTAMILYRASAGVSDISAADACRITVKNIQLNGLDADDVIEGCTDGLKGRG